MKYQINKTQLHVLRDFIILKSKIIFNQNGKPAFVTNHIEG